MNPYIENFIKGRNTANTLRKNIEVSKEGFMADTYNSSIGKKHNDQKEKELAVKSSRCSNLYSVISESNYKFKLNMGNTLHSSSSMTSTSILLYTELNSSCAEYSPTISSNSSNESFLSGVELNQEYAENSPKLSPTFSEESFLSDNESETELATPNIDNSSHTLLKFYQNPIQINRKPNYADNYTGLSLLCSQLLLHLIDKQNTADSDDNPNAAPASSKEFALDDIINLEHTSSDSSLSSTTSEGVFISDTQLNTKSIKNHSAASLQEPLQTNRELNSTETYTASPIIFSQLSLQKVDERKTADIDHSQPPATSKVFTPDDIFNRKHISSDSSLPSTTNQKGITSDTTLGTEITHNNSTISLVPSRKSLPSNNQLKGATIHSLIPSFSYGRESLLLENTDLTKSYDSHNQSTSTSNSSLLSHSKLNVANAVESPILSPTPSSELLLANTKLNEAFTDHGQAPSTSRKQESRLLHCAITSASMDQELNKNVHHNQEHYSTTELPNYKSGEKFFNQAKHLFPILEEVDRLDCSKIVFNLITGKFDVPTTTQQEKRTSYLDSNSLKALDKLVSDKFVVATPNARDEKMVLRNTFDENLARFDGIDNYLSNISRSMHEMHNFFGIDNFEIFD